MKLLGLDLDELFAHNRALFGDARMEATEDDDKSEEETEGTTEDETEETEQQEAEEEDKTLGPKGEKALAAEKEKRRQAQQDLREWKALGLSPAEIKKLIDTRKDGKEPDLDAVKREAGIEATKKANARILRSEIKAAAAGKLADPADALRLLDLDKFEIDDDGNVDEDEIADAIDELVKKKPYLAVQDGKRFKGKADGGTRKESRPAQLTEADVKRLYADKNYAEIEKARTEGRLDDLLGVNS